MQSGFTLRPLGLGDILDVTFKLFRQNFMLFVGIYALVLVPVAILQILLGSAVDLTAPEQMIPLFLVSAVLSVVSLVPFAAIIYAASERYLGKTVTIGESYSRAVPRFLPFLGAMIVAIVLAGLPAITIVGVIATAYLGIRWALLGQGAVLEEKGVRGALGRSWELVAGNWWKVFGTLLVLGILVGVITWILSGVLMAILAAVGLASGDSGAVWGIFSTGVAALSPAFILLNSLVSIVIDPLIPIGSTILYYDLRVRKEGYDLEVMARGLGQDSGGTPFS